MSDTTTDIDLFADTLTPVESNPDAREIDLVLTARTPISHHDPARQDESNQLLFLRRKQLVPGLVLEMDEQSVGEALDAVSAAHGVPQTIADLFHELSSAEFLATLIVRLFCDAYGRGEGTGLFKGTERYALLETRVRASAVRASSLRGLWNRLAEALQCPVAPSALDADLLRLFALPRVVQVAVLRCLTDEFRSVVMLARLWSGEHKAQDERYAQAAGRETSGALRPFPLTLEGLLSRVSGSCIVEVPAISSNSLRHQIVRGPAWRHLAASLGLPVGFGGDGSLPIGAEGIFENGGNIKAGAKQPSDPFGLAWEVRRTHPVLDLLGGVTDSFDLGESRLKVSGWLMCRENAQALAGTSVAGDPALSVSAFDLLDDQVHTRMATERGEGQMIYNFETLVPGTRVFVRLHLQPFTPKLTLGALGAALARFVADGGVVGGQSARGYGWMQAEVLTTDPVLIEAQAAYESYLAERKHDLFAGLVTGTLGARAKVVS